MLSTRSDSLTLWDLETELVESYQSVEDATTDEERETALRILDTYLTASVEKRDRVGSFLQHLTDLESAINLEAGRLADKLHRLKAAKSHMEQYILAVMDRVGAKKLEGKLFTFSARQNPVSVEIVDELAISPEFLVQPPPPPLKPDKTAIKEALKRGEEVSGAKLVTRKRLVIE